MTIKNAVLLLVLTGFLFPIVAFAGYIDDRSRSDDINGAVSLQGWYSQAEAKWQISFPYTTKTTNVQGKGESELRFKKIDSPLVIATAGGKVTPKIAFDVTYGYGSITGGFGTDSDRFLSSSGGRLDFSQSKNSLSGDVSLWGINVYYNNRRFGDKQAGPWGLILGFLHYEDKLRMTNAEQTVSVPFDGDTFPPVGPFPSSQVLNSTYDFSWNLLKVGISRQAELAKGFSYTGTLSVFPYVDYTGEGYWNLRAGTCDPLSTNCPYFRTQSPNFIQTSQKGYGYEASLGLTYEIFEHMELLVGYRYFFLYAGDGTDITYYANGTTSKPSTLDWVTVTRQGAYAEMLVKF